MIVDLTRETQQSVRELKQEIQDCIYDYERQAWIVNGCYVRCGHPATMRCGCYGRIHEGERVNS